MKKSPFCDCKTDEDYLNKIDELINEYPLEMETIQKAVLEAWDKIFCTKIGDELLIGKDIFPSPQILGNYLHELIPIIISKYDNNWHKDQTKDQKDLVYTKDNYFSTEIKTSSNKNNIYANRSYGIENTDGNRKDKSGFYIGVNFEKCEPEKTKPEILKIRFGWLDHSDWKPQTSQTGQCATLSNTAKEYKMKLIYTNPKISNSEKKKKSQKN